MRKLRSKEFLAILERRGLSVNAFALQSGIPQGTLSHLVSGDRNVGPKTLKRICDALHCEPGDISHWFYVVDQSKLAEIERMEQELLGHFSCLTRVQKERVIRMVQGLAEANRAEEELKHGIEYPKED